MKTFYSLLCTAIIIFAPVNLSAKIWTVDNNPGNSAANFTSIATAVANASVLDGDTIYVAGSSLDYGTSFTVTKKLYIFGPGYFLAENLDLQANTAPASISGSVTFDNGSEGSIIQGMTFENYVYFYTSNITFRRNRTYYFFSFSGSISNIIFVQNYCTNATSSSVMSIGSSNTNILVSNNFFENTSSGALINTPNPSNAIITNNVFSSAGTALTLGTGTSGAFDNNIVRNGAFTNNSLIVPRNNIGNSTQFGTANGNKELIDMATVFLNTGSSDAKWQILAAGPADDAGLSGEDCGMYGGNSPYVISGLPPIPSIYFFSSPTTGSAAQGLPVTIKAKSHN
jgi:hypothetical protein